MHLRKSVRQKAEVSLDEPLNVDPDGNELLLSDVLGTDPDEVSRRMEDEVELDLLRAALKKLSGREKRIVELRFGLDGGEGATQKQVADMLGISQSYISRLEKKIIRRLYDGMTSMQG
jgi:RNA polymerase sporulation-specific sigma factor